METAATLQHAILRGIELTFQLEEGEVHGEPLPSRDERNALLIYESTEGGAGVLARLVADAGALRRVIDSAIQICHFDSEHYDSHGRSPDALVDKDDPKCVAGCYRCLLSYYNQTDHEVIDRRLPQFRDLLSRLSRTELVPLDGAVAEEDGNDTGDFATALQAHGLPVRWALHSRSMGQQIASYLARAQVRSDTPQILEQALGKALDERGISYLVADEGLETSEDILRGIARRAEGTSPMTDTTYGPGELVRARGREWVVLPGSGDDILNLRPIAGTERDVQVLSRSLEIDGVESATFQLPTADRVGPQDEALLLRDAFQMSLRRGAGPFRSAGRIGFDPRAYQLVPMMMGLKLDVVRLLIADDVGIGKTIEAGLIARELYDRSEIESFSVLCPPHLVKQWVDQLRDKFHFPAIAVTPSSAARLERELPVNDSIFRAYPFTVVSLDYVKSDVRRDTTPESARSSSIVDEAHTCVCTGQGQPSAVRPGRPHRLGPRPAHDAADCHAPHRRRSSLGQPARSADLDPALPVHRPLRRPGLP